MLGGDSHSLAEVIAPACLSFYAIFGHAMQSWKKRRNGQAVT